MPAPSVTALYADEPPNVGCDGAVIGAGGGGGSLVAAAAATVNCDGGVIGGVGDSSDRAASSAGGADIWGGGEGKKQLRKKAKFWDSTCTTIFSSSSSFSPLQTDRVQD